MAYFQVLACWILLVRVLAAADPPAPRFLLPDVARPTRYTIDLTIIPGESVFRGVAIIDLKLKESLAFLWLNGKDLMVESTTVQAGSVNFPARTVSASGEFLGFAFPQTIGPGTARIEIRYRGTVSDKAAVGVFRKRSAADWYVFTTFTAIEARRAFPCFDEPRYKTPWQLKLHVKQGQVALANTHAVSEQNEVGGMKQVLFAETKPLPSSLIAFAVGPFEIVDAGPAGVNRVPVRIITPRGRSAEATAARAATPKLLERLEEYTGIPYPFDKLDHLALLEGAFGAVENPGLITYQQRILLANPEDDSPERQRGMRGTMAHEMAHQWFGNLVTMAGWEDVWLSEGFATWMAAKIMDEEQLPDRRKVFITAARDRAMATDAMPDAHAVRTSMSSRDAMRTVYGPLVYQKGAAALQMIENWMGREVLQQGIRIYLAGHQFGNATTTDFASAMAQASGRDPGPVLSSLLDRPGVPVITTELHCDPQPEIILRQDPYVPLNAKMERKVWSLPVCLKGDGFPGQCVTMEQREVKVPLDSCPSWVFANAGASGYYRTMLGPELLQSLSRHSDDLTAAERLSLALDISALVLNGRLPAGLALELLPHMARDSEPQVVLAAVNLAAALTPIVPASLKPRYDQFLRSTFGAAPSSKNQAVEALRRAQVQSLIDFIATPGDKPR